MQTGISRMRAMLHRGVDWSPVVARHAELDTSRDRAYKTRMTKAIAFLACKDASRARTFYEDVVGLQLLDAQDAGVVFDAYGTMLRIQQSDAVLVAPYTVFGLEVDDIEGAVDKLASKGVSGERYAHFEQDPRGIWTAPGGGRVFWFRDPEGHLLSLTQFS
jgi:predicted enzyme related to lactoylglutathione lyase